MLVNILIAIIALALLPLAIRTVGDILILGKVAALKFSGLFFTLITLIIIFIVSYITVIVLGG